MEIVVLTSASEVRGLQQIILDRAGNDGLDSASIVQHGAGPRYVLEKWDTRALGEVPTIQQIRVASERWTPPTRDDNRTLAARIKSLEQRLTDAGL